MRFSLLAPNNYSQRMRNKIVDVVFFSTIASLLLRLHFMSAAHDLWLLGALAFWWHLIDQEDLGIPELLLGSMIFSIPFSLAAFESVIYSHPLPVILGSLMNIPQTLFPSLFYSRYKKQRRAFYGFLGMLVTWFLISELRSSPHLNNILAVDNSLLLTLKTHSYFLSSEFPTVVVILVFFAGSLSFLHFTCTRRLFDFIVSGVCIILITLPISDSSGSEQLAEPESHNVILQTSFSDLETISGSMHPNAASTLDFTLGALIQQAHNTTELLLLPETVIRTPSSMQMVQEISRSLTTSIVGGAITTPEPMFSKNYNAALFFDGGEAIEVFRKWQLIPFFESSTFHRGNFMTTIAFGETRVLGILICMDATFMALVDQVIAAGATELIVLSASDYGFGYGTPRLQLSIAKRLAKRHAIPILLAATNGPSASINASGGLIRVTQEGQQTLVTTDSRNHRNDIIYTSPAELTRPPHWPDIFLCFTFLVVTLARNQVKWFSH